MQNIFNALIAQSDWTMLLLRVVLGVIFLVHGLPKAKDFKGTAGWLGSEGFKPGWFWAGLLTAAEIVGGICILLGVYTQLAAAVLTISMLVAMGYKMKNKIPFKADNTTGWEFDLLVICGLLILLTFGNGFFALGAIF